MKKALIYSLMLAGFTPCIAQSVDLELASITTNPSTIPSGGTGSIALNILQNGPDALPANAAKLSVSINTDVISYTLPATVTDGCGTLWSIQDGTNAATGQILLSNTSPLPDATDCILSIPITGVSQNLAVITVATTIISPGVSDRDGTNQGSFKTFQVDSPLPVTLSEFTVTKEANVAQLNWKTTEESNSDYFEIQHSQDAKSWNGLDRIKSQGESSIMHDYYYSHSSPLAGKNFYRLKMVDRDGSFAYSRIRNLNIDSDATTLTLAPNPVSDLLKIKTDDWAKVLQLEIVDLNGRTVVNTSSASAENGISVRNLDAGIYMLRIAKVNGETSVHKFMVNR